MRRSRGGNEQCPTGYCDKLASCAAAKNVVLLARVVFSQNPRRAVACGYFYLRFPRKSAGQLISPTIIRFFCGNVNFSLRDEAVLWYDTRMEQNLSAAERAGRFAEVRERSMFDIPIDVNYEDELLTLVTCSYYQDNGRFILFARRLRANETVESVSALVQEAVKVKEH